MASTEKCRVDTGAAFPSMRLNTTAGRSLDLADAFAGKWGVILLYRGDW